MAGSRIKGITVEIGGDTTGLDKALKGVNSTIRTTQTSLKDVNKLRKRKTTRLPLIFHSCLMTGRAAGWPRKKL